MTTPGIGLCDKVVVVQQKPADNDYQQEAGERAKTAQDDPARRQLDITAALLNRNHFVADRGRRSGADHRVENTEMQCKRKTQSRVEKSIPTHS